MRRMIPRAGEGAPLKAGDQQAARIGGPVPGEHIGDKRSGRSRFSARSLQLDISAETKFGEESESLFQLRHALPGEGRIKPVPSIIAPDFGNRQRAGPAAPVGRALEAAIVKQNRLAVTSEPDIELDPTAAEHLRFAETGKGVFGRARGGAAMADHRRESSFDLLPLSRVAKQGGQRARERRCDNGGKFAAVPPGIACRQFAAFTCCCSRRSDRCEPRSSPVS
jgi:hypothetical protein